MLLRSTTPNATTATRCWRAGAEPVRFTSGTLKSSANREAAMVTIPDSLNGHVFNATLDDDDVVVDAYVVLRVQSIESGDTSVIVGTTSHTDVVVATGLLACAKEIDAQSRLGQP